jgi:hypothetical protein
MDCYNHILEDLNNIIPAKPTIIPPFYNENDTPEFQIKTLLRQLRRAKIRKNRIETLTVMWYIGQILEVKVESSKQRTRCLELLTAHYIKASTWTYYLFELLGVEQIARTQYLTITILTKKLGEFRFRKLKEEADAIAGARSQEEEVVNGSTVTQLVIQNTVP